MNLTPNEREEILADYAESCRLRFIENPGQSNAIMAINQPDVWVKNCRESTIKSIRDGRDTWERIADVAAKHRLNNNSSTTHQHNQHHDNTTRRTTPRAS